MNSTGSIYIGGMDNSTGGEAITSYLTDNESDLSSYID